MFLLNSINFSRPNFGKAVLAALLFSVAALFDFAAAASPREIAAKVLPSVVMIRVFDVNGFPRTSGTGFFVDQDEVITNFHVLSGGSKATVRVVGSNIELNVSGAIATDELRDLALLKIESAVPTSARRSVLELSKSDPAIGDAIYVAGNPEELEGTFSSGLVSGKRKDGEFDLFQITAPISAGSSGSPVVDEEGHVIGVAVSTLRLGQNLNFAIPSGQVSSLKKAVLQPIAIAFRKVPAVGKEDPANEKFDSADGMISAYAFVRQGTSFSFSIKNNRAKPVYKVAYLIITYDKTGRLIDSVAGNTANQIIEPSLARRFSGSLSTDYPVGMIGELEIRILSYFQGAPARQFYTVTSGDTCPKIARMLGVTVIELQNANPGLNWPLLKIGDKIVVPTKE